MVAILQRRVRRCGPFTADVKTQTMPFDLAESFLLAAERELGASLPKSYRLAMLRENGGEIETDDDDWQQYPVADTSDRKRLSRSANHILKETESCRGWARFPENAVAIAGNGAGDHWYCSNRTRALHQRSMHGFMKVAN